jgi:hypothetical protein
VLTAVFAYAQVPQGINYQAAIRNSDGEVLSNQQIGLRMSILESNVTAVYEETHSVITNNFGLVTVVIGQGTATQGAFADIDWSTGNHFIQTEVDLSGGSNYEVMGSQQLMSVPYALYAKSAGSVSGGGTGTFTHYIGEEFGGGVIFHLWLDANGAEHGLIVDKTDLNTDYVWSNVDQAEIGLSAQSTWDGLSNSNAMVAQADHISSAANLCLNSNNSGQNDWYLPTIDELSLLWHNRYNVNRTLSTIGGASELPLVAAFYWSSNEYSALIAWHFKFEYGYAATVGKNVSLSVRGIRAF